MSRITVSKNTFKLQKSQKRFVVNYHIVPPFNSICNNLDSRRIIRSNKL